MINDNDRCVICGQYMPEGSGMVCEQCIQNSRTVDLLDLASNEAQAVKNIHIEDSYNVWLPSTMKGWTYTTCFEQTGHCPPDEYLNRSWKSIYIEWYLHNIGYWITLPFIKNAKIKRINERCKHVDLEEHR